MLFLCLASLDKCEAQFSEKIVIPYYDNLILILEELENCLAAFYDNKIDKFKGDKKKRKIYKEIKRLRNNIEKELIRMETEPDTEVVVSFYKYQNR